MEITRKKFLKLGLMGGARPSTRNALRSRRGSSRTAPRPRAGGDATTQAGPHGPRSGRRSTRSTRRSGRTHHRAPCLEELGRSGPTEATMKMVECTPRSI
jgi:hypothetical protein